MKPNSDLKSDTFYCTNPKPDHKNLENLKPEFPDFKMAESNALILQHSTCNVTVENIDRFIRQEHKEMGVVCTNALKLI